MLNISQHFEHIFNMNTNRFFLISIVAFERCFRIKLCSNWKWTNFEEQRPWFHLQVKSIKCEQLKLVRINWWILHLGIGISEEIGTKRVSQPNQSKWKMNKIPYYQRLFEVVFLVLTFCMMALSQQLEIIIQYCASDLELPHSFQNIIMVHTSFATHLTLCKK